MLVTYRLECTHKDMAELAKITERMFCGKCSRYRKVKAIESREWYFKCNNCSYARYNGQSKSQAQTLLGAHRIRTGHHSDSIWYRVHPAKKEAIQRVFGRKVRYVLTEDNKLYPDEYLTPAQSKQTIEEVHLPEKPPF